jgi:hypothetical protein
MITVDITYLVIGGVILLYLLFKLFEYKSRMAKPEYIYVDTSGIAHNPPQFIEVTKNKTINFKIGSHHIIVSQITVNEGMVKINTIASIFKSLVEALESKPKNKLDQVRLNVVRAGLYKQAVANVFKFSVIFAKNKKAYKKAIFKYAKEDYEGMLLIIEQIFDYWIYLKKLKALLAQGGSHRMIIGEGSTWNSYETDMTGKRIIKPRYALSMN